MRSPIAYSFAALLRNFLHRHRNEAELSEEIEQTRELLIEEGLTDGLTRGEAERAAAMSLGGVEQLKESVRQVRAGYWIDAVLRDITYGIRMLRRSRGFTSASLLILGLTIGANTAMFSVVRAVLLRPLAFPNSDHIETVQETNLQHGIENSNVSTASYLAWRNEGRSFVALSASEYSPFSVSGIGKFAERIDGWRVTANLFEVFKVRPIRGQLFTAANEQPGKDDVVIIRESLWKRLFDSDPNIIGRSIRVNDQPNTIVAVLPDSFNLGDREEFEMWKPLVLDHNAPDAASDARLVVRGLLSPSATLESARAEMATIARHLDSSRPAGERGWNARIISIYEDMTGTHWRGLLILFAALVVVLLIGCVNLSNLVLARSASRQRELAIRVALGADRSSIIRQLFVESATLALVGTGLGVLLAHLAIPVLISMVPDTVPRIKETSIDGSVLFFTAGAAVLAAIVLGVLPGWYASRVDPISAIKSASSRTQSSDYATGRLRRTLIAAEVAMSFTLLVSASLLVKSFAHLRNVDPGFHSENVLNNVIVLPLARYGQPDLSNRFARGVTSANPKAAQFFEQAFVEIKKLPGIISVGSITGLPLLSNSQYTTYRSAGAEKGDVDKKSVVQDTVGADYFQTLGIPLKRGRFFNEFDRASVRHVAIINEALAHRDFQGTGPIGQSIFIERDDTPYEIVGVVGDSKQFTLNAPAAPEVFTSVSQTPTAYAYVLVRSQQPNQRVAQDVRNVFASLDPDLPVRQRTLQSTVDRALASARFQARLLGGFSVVALLLAVVGVYSVLSYGVAQRRQEIGIRLALGASRIDIQRLIFGDGMKIILAGIVCGGLLSLAVATVLRSQLFQIRTVDPVAYLAVTIVLAGIAALACFFPAQRASKLEPVSILRAE